jgi:hypothetical protein
MVDDTLRAELAQLLAERRYPSTPVPQNPSTQAPLSADWRL